MDDREIVAAILSRNQRITQQFLYVKCYPLFKSIFDNYFTDCQTCVEFINEIYIHLMTPMASTGLCKLQSFQFGSTLTTWLKTVAVYYCYEHYRRKRITIVEEKNDSSESSGDRLDRLAASIYEEAPNMSVYDLETILNLMPNRRYSSIIRMLYLEGMTKEETAANLNINMANFYNLHLRAKQQFQNVLRKEGNYGTRL